MVARPKRTGTTRQALRKGERDDRPEVEPDLLQRARLYLQMLGRGDHPDAEDDPIHALYQVAIDFRCTAEGYRTLYFDRRYRGD